MAEDDLYLYGGSWIVTKEEEIEAKRCEVLVDDRVVEVKVEWLSGDCYPSRNLEVTAVNLNLVCFYRMETEEL